MSEKTTYINGCFVLERTFQDGSSVLNVSIPDVDDLQNELRRACTEGMSLRLKIFKCKEPKVSKKSGKVYATHAVCVDTWKPGFQAPDRQASPEDAKEGFRNAKAVAAGAKEGGIDPDDQVPF